ncbi:MAG: hypothetical protein GY816_17460, partial [Cytophagales bacterium]|nr:hypothetical protein [Cytophagales bacterium]
TLGFDEFEEDSEKLGTMTSSGGGNSVKSGDILEEMQEKDSDHRGYLKGSPRHW